MSDALKQIWAWIVSVGAGTWGFFSGIDVLAIEGVAVALVTLLERFRAARKHRAEEKLAMAKIEQITGE